MYKIKFLKNRNLSKKKIRRMQKLLDGNVNLNTIDFSKRYKCNCK